MQDCHFRLSDRALKAYWLGKIYSFQAQSSSMLDDFQA